MSAKTEETENKLIEERDKSYGTDGRVILPTPEQDQEAGPVQERNRIKRNQSILKRMQSYETHTSHLQFLNTIVSFVFDTIAGIIALLIANCVQVACIVIGSVYVNDCPIAPKIPIILIVSGSINVLICIMETIKRRINRNSNLFKKYNNVMAVLNIASCASFIAWMFIMYRADMPTFADSADERYCNKTLYLFAFWLLFIYLTLFVLILFITCCCCCFMAGRASNQPEGGGEGEGGE